MLKLSDTELDIEKCCKYYVKYSQQSAISDNCEISFDKLAIYSPKSSLIFFLLAKYILHLSLFYIYSQPILYLFFFAFFSLLTCLERNLNRAWQAI